MRTRLTTWRTRGGKTRRLRLYGAWKNLRGRISGRLYAGNGKRAWAGLECAFRDWEHFRSWAIANGYSKARCSLDRIDPARGYGPDNCQWLTVAENALKQNHDMREQEPDDWTGIWAIIDKYSNNDAKGKDFELV